MNENLRKVNFHTQLEGGGAWVGSPARIREQIARVREEYGGFEIASLQVNSHTISYAAAAASMKLFSEQVLPHFA
jgi:alkanesulfonate monooxygenase SsuD/methylene tetrahydromethanopterin reductase-like flavin-dependent oxidoreductase (luciferase family)